MPIDKLPLNPNARLPTKPSPHKAIEKREKNSEGAGNNKPTTSMTNRSLNKVLRTEQIAPIEKMRPATLIKIENAVIDLFATSDDSEVTMQAIAKLANVSLQTLYKYFGDKQTLVYAILDQVLGRIGVRMIDHLSGIESVKERLRKTVWVIFDFIDNNPKAVLFVSSAIPVTQYHHIAIYENKELMGAFLQVLSDGQKRGVLNQQVSLKVLFDVFMGFITRLGLMHVVRQVDTPLTDDFDNLFDMLWRAISQEQVPQNKVMSNITSFPMD